MVDPEKILPDISGLYSVHATEAMRPAVAYAAEIGGVEPKHVLGASVANLAFYVTRSQATLAKLLGVDSRILRDHKIWSDEVQERLDSQLPLCEYGKELANVHLWPWLAGNILASTEPEYTPGIEETTLLHGLRRVLPEGTTLADKEPSFSDKRRVLAEHEPAEIQASALALGQEICLGADNLAILVLANQLTCRTLNGPGHTEELGRLMQHVGDATSPPDTQVTFVDRLKQHRLVAKKMAEAFVRLGYKLDGPTILDRTQQGCNYFALVCSKVVSIAKERQDVAHDARNDLFSAYADLTRQELATLQRPYSFTSNKELRNSPYWGLCTALTGHGKEKLPFDALDQQQAAEIAATMRRLITFVAQSPGDPDQVLSCAQAHISQEQELLAKHEQYRTSASAGVIPALTETSLRTRYVTLAARWPKMRSVVRKTLPSEVIDARWYDDIDLVLAMIKEGEV